jgi:sugar phosphate isomerase/epimerase
MMTRRTMMHLLSATTVATTAQLRETASAVEQQPPLSKRLGVQMYMLGQISPSALPGILKQVREIGFLEVEALPRPDIPAQAFRAELDRVGLTCPSCHIALEPMAAGMLSLADAPAAIEYARTIGATQIVVPMFPFAKALLARANGAARPADPDKARSAIASVAQSMSADDWIGVARSLNEAAATLAPAGIRLGYHNHNLEFVPVGGGKIALDLLISHTDPRLVDMELDIGWVKAAGYDPAAFLKQHAHRITQVHLKDLAPTPANTALQLNTTELGHGVQDWPSIIEAIRSSSIRHAYIEQEPPYTVSGLKSAAEDYAFIQPLMTKKGI